MSHLGRPTEGVFDNDFSLAPIAKRLSTLLGQEVRLISDFTKGIEINPGEVVLCENVRFKLGEKANNDELAKQMASLCDIFVMDAFATAHRASASTYGVAKYAPIACAGPLLVSEIDALEKGLKNPKKPVLAIVGGSKVSTKVDVLEALIKKVDTLIVGGGIANTFIAAEGHDVGDSLYEEDFIDKAAELIEWAAANQKTLPVPTDTIVAEALSEEASASVQPVNDVASAEKILDIGPNTTEQLKQLIQQAGTILWNGPVGAFEIEQFSHGTDAIAKAVAESTAFSIAGGGDTLAAIEKYGVADKISYISTGGGAFLQCLEGKPLPAVTILEQRKGENA